MLEEQRKLVRIIAELTMYFLGIGAEHISSSIERSSSTPITAPAARKS